MPRIATIFIAISAIAVTVSNAQAAYCGQTFDIVSARNRWAAARQASVDPAYHDEACRAYGTQFFEAVTARQAASNCEAGDKRQRTLEILDSEIDAFNNLIAAQCSGS
ncbi:MAG TPA: hypothetical protein VJ376_04275 [Pseudomonadota bacterium]|nr:hypothetical protein [Pseudomonadota bacterium]